MADYWPRCKAHVIVRFDEFAKTTRLQKQVPKKTTKNLDGTNPQRSPLQVTVDPSTAKTVTRYILLSPGSDATNASPQARTKSGDGLTFDFVIIPINASWSQNGIRTADTLKLTFRYLDAPFDPRLLRSVAIELFLGCIDADAAAIENEQGPGGVIVPETWTDANGQTRTNLRFQGFVETWETIFQEGKEPMIEITCVDNTSLLLHQECPPRLTVDAKKPIDESIAGYLANFVQFAGMTVEYQPANETKPVLADVLSHTAFRPKLGPQPTHGGATEKLSVWDYLTDICRSIGHAVYVDGTRIVIQRVRSLLANSLAANRPNDPFIGRVVDGENVSYRRLIFGRNILSMRPKRSFARHLPPNIEIRAYSAERKTVIVGRFPLPGDRQYYALPGDTTPDQKWTVKTVFGINDEKTLRVIAQEEYEQHGRQELQVEIKTRALASFGGNNSDPDILDIRFADTVELLTNRSSDESSSVTLIEKALTAQARAAEFLINLGFEPDFAEAYGNAYTNAGFVTQFRVKQMRVDWAVAEEGGHGGGVQITIGAMNYTAVRADVALPPGEEPVNTAATSGGK